jgi:hypothetical protein
VTHNPDPIRIVPAAQRDVWVSKPEHRCYWEDGRGRCRRYDTTPHRVEGTPLGIEWYCPLHPTSLVTV